MHTISRVFASLLPVLFLTAAAAQGESVVVRQLLDRPAPVPEWKRPFSDKAEGGVPPDDAPDDVLVAFWSSEDRDFGSMPSQVTPKVRQRLLEAALRAPDRLPAVLRWLPETPEAIAQIKSVYDKMAPSKPAKGSGAEAVHDWLMLRSRYFRQDLIREAGNAQFGDGYFQGKDALEALAKLDWSAAQALLAKQAEGDEPHVAAVGLGILYLHSAQRGDGRTAAPLRARLRALAQDRKAPGFARNEAIEALMKTKWQGRDAWFLSLFGDATLTDCIEKHTIYAPLCGPVRDVPNYWIPIVTKKVGDRNRAIHDNAVHCLIQFHLESARADALRPLLPWLSNPKWSSVQWQSRLRLVQSLDKVHLPESVPGLLWVLEHETDYMQAGAADALVRYRPKKAGPALRKAFARGVSPAHSRNLVAAMLACEALSDREIADAIETFARDCVTHPDRPEVGLLEAEDPLPRQVRLGGLLARMATDRDEVARLLLQRVDAAVAGKEPEVATMLRRILLSARKTPAVDRDLVGKLKGKAEMGTVLAALARGTLLAANARRELDTLVARGGWAAGVAAAVRGDAAECRHLLQGRDRSAQKMLLACARLTRLPLPVPGVGRLLGQEDKLLALAAERYLESEDGPEARKLVWARHPGEARILGGRMSFDPGHVTFGEFDRSEQRLRKEILCPNGPDEIFALLSEGYWGNEGQRIVRVNDTSRTLQLEVGNGKTRTRALTEKEFASLRKLIAAQKIDDLPPLNTTVCDGIQIEYLHLTRAGGRRVFMNNPGMAGSGGTGYDLVTRHFRQLAATGRYQVRHALQDAIQGAEIVLSDPEHPVAVVWKKGDDLRVLLADGQWRQVRQGRLGKVAAQPPECAVAGWFDDVQGDREIFPAHMNRYPWQVRAGEDRIRAAVDYRQGRRIGGLWRCRKGAKPRKICENAFARPIVTPDGKWAVAARSDEGWARPHPIIRVNLATGKQFPIDVGPRASSGAVCFLPAHGKVLISLGPKDPEGDRDEVEYRLLDPATGKTRLVQGECAPLVQQSYRPLQPTSRPHEAWAAIYDRAQDTTRIGRYDVKRFRFTAVLSVPQAGFSSMGMWVDEPAGVAYVVIQDDLLRIPLPAEPSSNR